jgi:hypothetical protein
MNTGKLVFSGGIDQLPLYTFRRCVVLYRGNFIVKSFTCLSQYLCMAFAQMTFRESSRIIKVFLRAPKSKRYHMGIRSTVSRNTLANTNKTRDWRIYNQKPHTPRHMRLCLGGKKSDSNKRVK